VWLNIDEGNAASIALRLLDGRSLPYVDGVSIRGPLMYWIYELVLRVGGLFNLEAIRVGGLLSSLATTVCVWSLPAVLGLPLVGGFAALAVAWVLTVGWMPNEGLAWNAEIMALPFALCSVTCAVWAMRHAAGRRSLVALAVSGALGTMAFFVKQPFGPHLVWTALVVLVAGGGAWRQRGQRLLAMVLGSVVVQIAVLLPYVVTHTLRDFWFYFVEYGSRVHLDPVTWADRLHAFRVQVLGRLTFSVPFAAALVVGGLTWRRALARHGGVLLLGHAVLAVVMALLTGRTFGHYFLQSDAFAVVFVVVATSGALVAWLRSPRLQAGAAVTLAATLVVLLVTGQSRVWHTLREGSWGEWFHGTMVPSEEPISTFVRNNSQPDDTIFVWGFRGDVYINAQRKPASRFVFSVFLSGVVPWYEETPRQQRPRIVPGSHALLLSELRASRPRVIVDAGFSMLHRYMVQFPELRRYLEENYRLAHVASIFGGRFPEEKIPIYLRKDTTG
jgi:hypothetical protein